MHPDEAGPDTFRKLFVFKRQIISKAFKRFPGFLSHRFEQPDRASTTAFLTQETRQEKLQSV